MNVDSLTVIQALCELAASLSFALQRTDQKTKITQIVSVLVEIGRQCASAAFRQESTWKSYFGNFQSLIMREQSSAEEQGLAAGQQPMVSFGQQWQLFYRYSYFTTAEYLLPLRLVGGDSFESLEEFDEGEWQTHRHNRGRH